MEISLRAILGIFLLLTLLSTIQACRSSIPSNKLTKEQVEVALNTLISQLETQRPKDATAYAHHLRSYLETNPAFYGAAVALLDESKNVIASPYVYRTTDGFQTLDLATPDYEIENQAWFFEPLLTEDGVWTAPYFDQGGGEIWMITFAAPARDADGIFAIVTTDLPSDATSE